MVEHWVCENCDSVDPPTFKGDEKACGICADEGENGLLIELVPARRLRWAEDLLRAVAQSACEVDDPHAEMLLRIDWSTWRELASYRGAVAPRTAMRIT
jgi:hypothetical protein